MNRSIAFTEWCFQVDALCQIHLKCSWADLCGDISPLERAHYLGETPRQFVEWWASKYELLWFDEWGD